MSRLNKMKEDYNHISIPEELDDMIQQQIQKSRTKQAEQKRVRLRNRAKKSLCAIGTAAVVCILFAAALNTSYVFAKEAAKLPIIGEFARILTFRTYEENEDNIAVSVRIPTIEMITEDTGINIAKINQEILTLCNQYANDAVLRAEEYRSAFLETGGTLEEWAEHNVEITVDYEIKNQNKDYLSFVVRGTENWTNAYSESRYYNLRLPDGKTVTLKDMLGEKYIENVNESIMEQITERQNAGETFFGPEEGGFTTITDDTKFYINANNHPVIVFEKYEIAPGSSGEIEFEIGETEDTKQDTATEKTELQEEVYEDNFDVDSKAAKEFAQKIKDAVAKKDLEALAQLTAFPVYVGLENVGMVETKEDFLKLGAETVFTEELLKSVSMAEIDDYQPCMAGFPVSDGGITGINFGVVDGALAVNGINY